jgi:hypothetical protein
MILLAILFRGLQVLDLDAVEVRGVEIVPLRERGDRFRELSTRRRRLAGVLSQ